jgi:uncharacterized membrane protein YgcG
MKTLKIVLLMILFSLFMTSCTDLINSDDHAVMDTIENTTKTSSVNQTGGSSNGGSSGSGGKGGGSNGGG